MFPKRYVKKSAIEWDVGSQYNTYEGDVSAGMLAGMIRELLGQQNYDNLAKCIHPTHIVDQSFGLYHDREKNTRGATNLIFRKRNEDIW